MTNRVTRSTWARIANCMLWITAILLLILLATQAPLMLDLSSTAQESFPHGVDSAGSLHRDNLARLSQYPPARLGWYLHCPSPRWRAVICQVLGSEKTRCQDGEQGQIVAALLDIATHDSNRAVRGHAMSSIVTLVTRYRETRWRNLAPELARLALDESNPEMSHRAGMALAEMQQSASDESNVLLSLASQATYSRGLRIVYEAVARLWPDARQSLHVALQQLAGSPSTADRRVALYLLAEHFPQDSGIGPLVAELATELLGQPGPFHGELQVLSTLARLVESRPLLFESLLGSERSSQLVALAVLRQHPPDVASTLGKRALEAAERLSEEGQALAVDFLAASPEGLHRLLAISLRSDAGVQARILRHRSFLFGPSSRRATDGHKPGEPSFLFTRTEADALVGMLRSPERRVRDAVATLLEHHIFADAWGGASLFPPQTGPLDTAHIDLFRQLLDRKEYGRAFFVAGLYFAYVAPVEESDIPRISAAIRRNANVGHWLLSRLIERFPNDPRTVSLAREILADSQSHPFTLDLAGRLLLHVGEGTAVLDRTLDRFLSENASRFWLVPLLLEAAIRAGGIDEPGVAQQVWDRCLEQPERAFPATAPPGPKHPLPFMQIEPPTAARAVRAVGTEIATTGLQEHLRRRLRAPTPVTSWAKPFVNALSSWPGFALAVIDPLIEAIDSDDAETRKRGLRFLRALRTQSQLLAQAALVALGDPDARVRASAARALGAAQVLLPTTVEQLRERVLQDQAEQVRLTALIALRDIVPDEPGTLELARHCTRDPSHAVRATARTTIKDLSEQQDNATTRAKGPGA